MRIAPPTFSRRTTTGRWSSLSSGRRSMQEGRNTVKPPPRKILLVAHGAPPSPLPGARRIGGLTRYLDELGHEVTVLTSSMYGRGPGHWGAARIIRTRDAI